MTEATMTRVTDSDTPMYGPRALLVCGYAPAEQDSFLHMLHNAEIQAGIPVIFCAPEDGDVLLSHLLSREDGTQRGQDSKMPRAVILSGVTERELRRIMTAWKGLNLGRQLWAALTPTSETWTLRALIRELQSEFMAMLKNQQE